LVFVGLDRRGTRQQCFSETKNSLMADLWSLLEDAAQPGHSDSDSAVSFEVCVRKASSLWFSRDGQIGGCRSDGRDEERTREDEGSR
jgi:hypothetical protein